MDPETDAALPAFWQQLGIPGAIDLHVHFMPEQVLRKVWAYFDGLGSEHDMPWPISYRLSEDDRVARLRALGVQRFSALAYAHRPGMAAWLNDWLTAFAVRVPDAVHSATFHCEPEADADVAHALEAGARLFKVHLQVGAFRSARRAAQTGVAQAGGGWLAGDRACGVWTEARHIHRPRHLR